MNCHDARERLSEFLDEALSPGELGEIRSHLEGCPECRRELERLRATLSILSRVERPRAPVGFVERVMEAARPVPWYRRLGHWLFVPLGTKLPAEAAAMAMISRRSIPIMRCVGCAGRSSTGRKPAGVSARGSIPM